MKVLNHFLLTSLFFSATMIGCKKTVKVGSGGASGASNSNSVAQVVSNDPTIDDAALSEEMSEIDGDVSTDTPANEQKFSLVKFIKTKPALSSIYGYIDDENTKLYVGDKKKFYLETDATIMVSPKFAESLDDRQLMGAYWIRGYMLNKLMTNSENESGLLVDIGAEATLDKLAMDAHFRYIGVDVASRTITAGFDQSFVRDYEIKAGANAFLVGVEAGGKVGGEVGMRAEFGVRKDNVLNLIFTPRASMIGGVLAGAKLLAGAVGLNAEGETKLVDLKVRGNSNLGVVPNTKLLYADIGIDGGAISFNDGKIDLVGRSFANIEFYRQNIYDPKPTYVKAMPLYGTVLVKYLKKPSASECVKYQDLATTELAKNRVKMKAFEEVVAAEDKPLIQGSIKRMGDILAKVKNNCG